MKTFVKILGVLVVAAVSFGGGYAVRSFQVNPDPVSGFLGVALNELHRGSAKAQQEYEERQSDLNARQTEIVRQEDEQRRKASEIEKQRTKLETALVQSLKQSNRDVAVAESVVEPEPVAEAFPVTDPDLEPCVEEIKLATRWEHVARVRQTALVSTIQARDDAIAAKVALTRNIVAERAYSAAVVQERDVLKERFELADTRANKLAKGRVKWWVAGIAALGAGYYLGAK